MRALVIAPQPFFSPRGTPLSVYYRALIMANQGVSIDLLTYGQGQDVDIPGVNIIRIPRFALFGDVKIGPSILKVFLDIFVAMWTVFLLTTRKYDFVHAHEEAVFIAVFLKPLYRFKLVYDMHSSLPQQLDNFDFKWRGLFVKLFSWLESLSLKKSDAVITICPALADYAAELMGRKEGHYLIENSLFEPVRIKGERIAAGSVDKDCGDARLKLSLPASKKLVVYAGTLEPYQGIGMLLESLTHVKQRRDDAHLVIVGGQPSQVQQFRQLAAEFDIADDVTFVGQVSTREAADYLAVADVLVSPRSAGTNTPLKIYQLIASGKPLVATAIFSHTQVLNDDVAFLVQANSRSIAEGLIQALSQETLVGQKTASARSLYEQKYSKRVYSGQVSKLLATLR